MRHPHLMALRALTITLAGCGEKIDDPHLSRSEVAGAEATLGLSMTDAEVALMRDDLVEQRDSYQRLRENQAPNSLRPALRFDPELLTGPTAGIARPADLNDLAFASRDSSFNRIFRPPFDRLNA
jgi:hypothetical protein